MQTTSSQAGESHTTSPCSAIIFFMKTILWSWYADNFSSVLCASADIFSQVIWLTILTTAALTFLSSAWTQLPLHHHFLIPILLSAPYVFTYLCAASTASVITEANHTLHLTQYPYDHTIYHPNNVCHTCKLTKPARSKHCPLCKTCVARHDHHCVWVTNCLGQANYRWFLALLVSLGVLLMYGTFLAYTLLSPAIHIKTRARGFLPYVQAVFTAWGGAIQTDIRLGAVGLLALLTCPLAWGLFGYHVYLLWAGMTTNETSKWQDLQEDMADGIVWKGRRAVTEQQKEEAREQWPVQSDQIVVRMTDAAQEPTFKFAADRTPAGGWERCWQLAQLTNLYDLGLWDTLLDVVFVF